MSIAERLRSPSVVLAATIAAAMLVMANVAVLNVALPELSVELGASQAEGQWMVDVYSVVLASLLLPVGAIGDRFGRRLILLVGLVILASANAVTVGLNSADQVIVARAVSGVGAAFVFPATLSTITATLPDELRSRGIAMWTAAVSAGGFVGILVAGLLIENFWWGSIFLSMTAGAFAVLLFCFVAVPDSSDPSHSNLDPVGALLSMVAFGGLVLGIIEGPVEGWTAPLALTGLIAGSVALAGFGIWEWKYPRPLLDVRLFVQRGVRAGSLSVFVQFVGAFGIFFVVVFYLSVVLGYGALDVGLSLLPISITLLPASAVALPLARRFGRRIVGGSGILIMAVAFSYAATIDAGSGFRHLFVALMLMGVGFGLAGPPATEAIVESLPAAKQGVASALNDVLRELGAAIGIAISGSAFNAAYRAEVGSFTEYPAETLEVVRESPFAFARVAPELGEDAERLLGDIQRAVVEGWSRSMVVLAVAMAVGAVGFLLWAPGRQQQAHDATDAPAPLARASLPGPLGAVELAASAEVELQGLVTVAKELQQAVSLLDRRSAPPTDMSSWPATEQVQTVERAVLAMEAPLAELDALAQRLLAKTADCDLSVSSARAELMRLGRDPRQLGEMERLIGEAYEQSLAGHEGIEQLTGRFEELAATMSTLRPAARQIASSRTSVVRAHVMVSAWLDQGSSGTPPGVRATVGFDPEVDLRA